jgi:hypothetical protein
MSKKIEFQDLLKQVELLTYDEKLILNDLIWEEITIPIEHQEIVNQRIEEMRNDPKKMLDWELVKKKMF